MTVTYGEGVLTLPPADVDQDGNDEQGVFVFKTNITIAMETRTGRIGSGKLSQANAVFSDWVEDQTGEEFAGTGKRQQLMLDLGAGEHVIEIDFQGFEGSTHQWGDSGEGGTASDATGENVNRQMELLDRYLQVCEIDSRPGHEALLEVGNYSTDGYYEPLTVAPEQPRVEFDAEEQSSTFDGSLTFVEIASLSNPYDAASRNER
ncbi:hypothetical protein [Halorussus marinus]|uniref:hypothetical protein n=1 Tax=Halorussus marinus TaxID=2505976 RepID=UPI001091D56D|nr:hypothetical protein [Halorussus marinus]